MLEIYAESLLTNPRSFQAVYETRLSDVGIANYPDTDAPVRRFEALQ
jgi:hypothetical protein